MRNFTSMVFQYPHLLASRATLPGQFQYFVGEEALSQGRVFEKPILTLLQHLGEMTKN